MRLVYGGRGLGLDGGTRSRVLSREGDVSAWVLLCRPRGSGWMGVLDLMCAK